MFPLVIVAFAGIGVTRLALLALELHEAQIPVSHIWRNRGALDLPSANLYILSKRFHRNLRSQMIANRERVLWQSSVRLRSQRRYSPPMYYPCSLYISPWNIV